MTTEDNEMTRDRLAWLAEGNATQARKRVAAKAIVSDDAGRVLLVNPTYKEHWDLPGGMAEANEPPTRALQRELHEELGLQVRVGRLLVLEWAGPHGPWDDQLVFLFDAGVLTTDQIDEITVIDDEISEFRFFSAVDAKKELRADVAELLGLAMKAHQTGQTHYLETRSQAMRYRPDE